MATVTASVPLVGYHGTPTTAGGNYAGVNYSGTFIPTKVRSPIKAGEVAHPALFPAHLPTTFRLKSGLPSSAGQPSFQWASESPNRKKEASALLLSPW